MIRRPPRSTQSRSSAASDVYKRQVDEQGKCHQRAENERNPPPPHAVLIRTQDAKQNEDQRRDRGVGPRRHPHDQTTDEAATARGSPLHRQRHGGYTSAVPLAMEWTPPRRRGLVSGLIMWMSPWANASIAALVFVLLGVLGPDQYSVWGWRIPFILGALMAFALLIYYRKYVSDSPAWKQAAKASHPLRDILVGAHRRPLWQVFVLMSGMWLFTNMAIAVLTGQLKASGHLTDQGVSFTMMCATVVSAIAMAACGYLSPFVGRRVFFVGFGVLSAVLAPIVYLTIFRQTTLIAIVLLVGSLQIVTVSVYGPVAAYLTERFPTAVRSSGYGVAYSLSIVLPALYPYYLPPLQRALGDQLAVAALLALAGVLVAAGAATGPETSSMARIGAVDGRADAARVLADANNEADASE